MRPARRDATPPQPVRHRRDATPGAPRRLPRKATLQRNIKADAKKEVVSPTLQRVIKAKARKDVMEKALKMLTVDELNEIVREKKREQDAVRRLFYAKPSAYPPRKAGKH